jgi:hypothetical protein
LREWKDLSFLKGQNTEPEDKKNHRIYQAQISCVVYGFDEWKWDAYAFVDTEHELHDGDDLADKGTPSEEYYEDPIASGQDARRPIWKPRQYFLKTFEIRAKEIRREWDQLVRHLVLAISQYVCCVTFKFLNSSC